MKKIVLTFGLISAVIMMVLMCAALPFDEKIGLNAAMAIGYTIIVSSFMLVFFGIRSYRENVGGGAISFGRAFAIGILITLMASASYVIIWEIIYFGLPGFGDRFVASYVQQVKSSGASPESIQSQLDLMKHYNNPFFNAAVTFTEPFPVGLIITLVSALILRRRNKPQSNGNPAAVAA
jgi:Protein of unknown function (DUF4199)